MICPKRLTELIELHLSPFNDKDQCWEIGVSKIAGRGVFVTRKVKRGDIIFRDSPLLIGPAARQEDTLNTCTVCFKLLNEEKFMCRQGCSLPVCSLCAKKKQHKAECDLLKSWQPIEPDVANSVIIRLLCVAKANLLNKEQKELIYSLQANLDNNTRTEVRNAGKCFRNFPIDKKIIELMNRAVAAIRTDGFDSLTSEQTTENEDFPYRALFPLFGVLNHCCVPNSTFSFEDKTNNMIVKAAVDMDAGTEVTTTYTKLFSGNIARHLFLKMKKSFTCKCERCSDPTEKGAFISAVYCRDPKCEGLAVPETTGLPHPNWNCTVCNQKSQHAQIIKSQDFASGAINSIISLNSLKGIIAYINEKTSGFIPDSNYVIINTKLLVIKRLEKSREDCDDEDYKSKTRYCDDILQVMDKLGVGDCPMRVYLEREKLK